MITQTNNSAGQPIHFASLGKRMLLGAAINLILIGIFLSGVNETKPEWGKLWIIRPLVIVPLAGAVGGAVFYFIKHLRLQLSWSKTVALILSVVIYIIGLWLGKIGRAHV